MGSRPQTKSFLMFEITLLKRKAILDSQGLLEARQAIMEECLAQGIIDVNVDDIFVGNGVSELISMSMQAPLK